jgi:hypothetical protein
MQAREEITTKSSADLKSISDSIAGSDVAEIENFVPIVRIVLVLIVMRRSAPV